MSKFDRANRFYSMLSEMSGGSGQFTQDDIKELQNLLAQVATHDQESNN